MSNNILIYNELVNHLSSLNITINEMNNKIIDSSYNNNTLQKSIYNIQNSISDLLINSNFKDLKHISPNLENIVQLINEV